MASFVPAIKIIRRGRLASASGSRSSIWAVVLPPIPKFATPRQRKTIGQFTKLVCESPSMIMEGKSGFAVGIFIASQISISGRNITQLIDRAMIASANPALRRITTFAFLSVRQRRLKTSL